MTARTMPALMAAALLLTSCQGDSQAVREPSATEPASSSSSPARTACGARDARLVVRFRARVDGSVRERYGDTRARFARQVLDILCDERGWLRAGMVRFAYDPDGPYLIGLRSKRSVKRRCEVLVGEPVSGRYSCASSAHKEVVINTGPWHNGTPDFPANLRTYRRMLINHEVGHVMTLRHRDCPGDGRKAPVMMQQSMGMNLNGYTCTPNPWPKGSERRELRDAH